jgi:hypothetical protein
MPRTALLSLPVLLAVLIPIPLPASSVTPTWIESVAVTSNGTSSTVITTPTFYIANLSDPHAGNLYQYDALIDYQGVSGPISGLTVLYAAWNFDPSTPGYVPVDVWAFAASPAPPSLSSPPVVTYLYTLDIPTGNYVSDPLPISLTGQSINGGECFLLSVNTQLNAGPPSVIFDPPSVPEPSSMVLIAIGCVVVFAAALIDKFIIEPRRRNRYERE